MFGFSFIAFIQSVGGILAAYEAMNLKVEDAWSRIKINEDKSIEIQ
jgi:cellulose synthase (UDP-forming)